MLVDVLECNIPNQANVKSLNVLLKVLQNIRQHPDDDKYRHLKKSNAAIGPMLDLVGMKDFLQSVGFEEAPQSWDYHSTEDSYQIVNKVYNLLNSRLGGLQVISDLDPAIEKLVKESKLKYQKQKQYKQQILERMRLDRIEFKQKQQQQKKKGGKQ